MLRPSSSLSEAKHCINLSPLSAACCAITCASNNLKGVNQTYLGKKKKIWFYQCRIIRFFLHTQSVYNKKEEIKQEGNFGILMNQHCEPLNILSTLYLNSFFWGVGYTPWTSHQFMIAHIHTHHTIHSHAPSHTLRQFKVSNCPKHAHF